VSRFLSPCILLVLALTAWGDAPRPEVGPLVQADNLFALDLFGRMRQQEGNFVFSPYAVSSSLALTSFGARGRTADELNRAIHLLDQERLHDAFQALNETIARGDGRQRILRMTVKTDLRGTKDTVLSPTFLQMARSSYGAHGEGSDHVSANPNRFARQDMDEETAPEPMVVRQADMGDDTRPLNLLSAARFDVRQESALAPQATPVGTFVLANGHQVKLPFFKQTGLFAWAETKDAQLVELPIPESDLRLVVLLPRTTADLEALEKSLDLETLVRMVNRASPREVEVKLPRCRINFNGSLKKPLTQLGLGILFGPGADLSGLSDASKNIHLADVLHHAAIDLGSCKAEPLPPRPSTGGVPAVERVPPVVFQADRPFLFLVRDAGTGAILLMGRVADPSQQ
jgi:serpin B